MGKGVQRGRSEQQVYAWRGFWVADMGCLTGQSIGGLGLAELGLGERLSAEIPAARLE